MLTKQHEEELFLADKQRYLNLSALPDLEGSWKGIPQEFQQKFTELCKRKGSYLSSKEANYLAHFKSLKPTSAHHQDWQQKGMAKDAKDPHKETERVADENAQVNTRNLVNPNVKTGTLKRSMYDQYEGDKH